jgi:Ca2+/Na+ antiporter
MRTVTSVLAAILVALGAASWAAGGQAWSAGWPALLGVLLGVAAALARTPHSRQHAMHAACMLALAGIVASALGASLAPWARWATGLPCALFLVLAVRSFVRVRLARKASTTSA